MAKNVFGLVHTMLDDSGALEPGGTIEVYEAGTTTPQTVYSDRALSTTAGYVITADAAGRLPERWISDETIIKLVYKDASGATLATRDYANDNADGLDEPGVARTSWFGTNDAALTSTKTLAGVGGTVIVDNAVVLTSTATLDGYVTRFEGGTLAPAASTATLTMGKIEAPPDRQIFLGSNIARVRVTANCEHVRPEWFGAVADGSTSDSTAFSAALAACGLASGICLRAKAYALASTLVIGDGTTTTRSTIHNGFFMRGVAAGVGAGEFGSPNILTSLKWIGATGATEKVTQIAGGIHSVQLSGFIVDCNGKAGVAGEWIHLYRCEVSDVYAENWYAEGWSWDFGVRDNAAYVSPYSAGVTQGAMESIFRRFGSRTPPAAKAHCLRMTAGITNNIGYSRNKFEQCQFIRGNTTDSISIQYRRIDNNSFDDILTIGTGTNVYDGIAVRRLTASGDGFPYENTYKGGRVVGELQNKDNGTLSDSTDGGWDLILGHGALNDGADVTPPHGFKVFTTDGRMLGGFAGSATEFHGCATGGLSTTALYFAADGNSAGDAFTGNLVTLFTVAHELYRLRARCSVAPGVGASRTATVYVNGVATSLTISFGAAESGDKVLTLTSPASISAGDYAELRWTHSGTPAGAQVAWGIYGYPLEAVR